MLQTVGNTYGNFSLATMFPRREFTKEDYRKKLLDLELAPSASVVLLPVCIYIYFFPILTVLFLLLLIVFWVIPNYPKLLNQFIVLLSCALCIFIVNKALSK